MRQIDLMIPAELEVLKLKNMLPTRPIQRLHPSLRACACGFIGSRSALYRHFDIHGKLPNFFTKHGEVPLNEDDPRLNTELALRASLTLKQKLQTI